jgi:hypothetical protein
LPPTFEPTSPAIGFDENTFSQTAPLVRAFLLSAGCIGNEENCGELSKHSKRESVNSKGRFLTHRQYVQNEFHRIPKNIVRYSRGQE